MIVASLCTPGGSEDQSMPAAVEKSRGRAVVIGGSMGGLFCGLHLARIGFEVDIFERSAVPLVGRGAGIITHTALHDALADVTGHRGDDLGVPISYRIMLDDGNRRIGEHARAQIATTWNRLYSILMRAFPASRYHLAKDLVSLSQSPAGVALEFADGTRERADLVVGADGFRSAVRAFVSPAAQPKYAGYVAWRGMIEEGALSPETHATIFPHMSFFMPEGEQFLGYPVPGANDDLTPGKRYWNIVWYRPADAATELPRFLTDETGQTHSLSIPPPLIAKSTIASVRDAARRLLPSMMREAFAAAEQPFLQPIYDLATPKVGLGRVALIGDAGFVARPHVGAGVTKAADDAAALARSLASEPTIERALEAFDSMRNPVNARIVARAQWLGSYIRRSFSSPAEREAAMRVAAIPTVLSEAGTIDFLGRPA
jgi:2-polyprenyl-6-methoxyphenol hydroxylase-like FAD-dependent oxidoreductase